MTVIEMIEELKRKMEEANLSFEEAIAQARQLETTDLGELSARIQVILESCGDLILRVNNVVAQGEEIQNVVGR
jgi:exonuclease VII small subunit